jgi:hypothetical protein
VFQRLTQSTQFMQANNGPGIRVAQNAAAFKTQSSFCRNHFLFNKRQIFKPVEIMELSEWFN